MEISVAIAVSIQYCGQSTGDSAGPATGQNTGYITQFCSEQQSAMPSISQTNVWKYLKCEMQVQKRQKLSENRQKNWSQLNFQKMLQIIIKVAPILIPSRFIYACSMPAPALYTLFSSVIWCIVISIFLPRPWPRLLSAPTSISLNYDPRRPAAGDLILILIGFL